MLGHDAPSTSRQWWIYVSFGTAIAWLVVGIYTLGRSLDDIWNNQLGDPNNNPTLSAAAAIWGSQMSLSALGLSGATYLLEKEPANLDYFLVAFLLPYGLTIWATVTSSPEIATLVGFSVTALAILASAVPSVAAVRESWSPMSKYNEDSELAGLTTE